MSSALPALFGYDPALLARLKPRRRRAIHLLAEAWIISSAALAASVGYAIWLVEHALLLSLLCALGMGLVVLNLLRMVIAGGGAAPHLSEQSVRQYRPALGPTIVLSVLSMLLAQPGQLPLWQEELAPKVAEHREALLARQAELAHTLNQPVHLEFREELARSDFLAFRVREIWTSPQRAFALSVLFWFLVLSPTLAGRFIALSALREYERARWLAVRAQIEHEGRTAAAQVDAALTRYPSYRKPAQSAIAAPFDTKLPFLSRPPMARPPEQS